MGCLVTETTRTVFLSQINALPIDPGHPRYPFPPLEIGTGEQQISLPLVVLENDWIRAEIAPSLGGRILSLTDKKKEAPTIDRLPIKLDPSGRLVSDFGAQLVLGEGERKDSLAEVDVSYRVADEGDGAEVVVGSVSDWPFGYLLKYMVVHDRADLVVEVKVQNRDLRPVSYNGGLDLDGLTAHSEGLRFSGPKGRIHRFPAPRSLAPRQVDSWEASIAPFPTAPERLNGPGFSVKITDQSIEFLGWKPMTGLKAVLLTARGESLEASLSLEVGTPLLISIPPDAIPLGGIVVLDDRREELLRSPRPQPPIPNDVEAHPTFPLQLPDSESQIRFLGFNIENRALSHLLIAMKSLAKKEFEKADFELEQSLLYNGDDHLAWWLKARALALQESSDSPSDELLNAHYLWPLEPALRVEGFLNQPIQPGNEPNPLLENLLSNPDAVMDVAGMLIQSGLHRDAVKLVSEVIRTDDRPMYRYFLAYCYLQGSNLLVEAAEQIRAASRLGLMAPYPFRPIEHQVLAQLGSRWGDTPELGAYLELSRAITSKTDSESA